MTAAESTPSAITDRLRLWARSTTERTIALAVSSVSSGSTNDLSILTAVTGRRCRYESERVARAEVVEGETHAVGDEGLEAAQRALGIEHDGALGDLELDRARGAARTGSRRSVTALMSSGSCTVAAERFDGHRE